MLYLTLRHYEYVCAIAQHGSLSAAAAAAHVSQPALSNALARVEEHLGQALFLRRKGAAVVLTPQGRIFAEQAQALLDQAARLEGQSDEDTSGQKLTIGCFSDLAPFVLAPALQALRSALPEVAIRYRVDDFEPLIAALTGGDVDMAISYDLGVDGSFARQELSRRAPRALVPQTHPLARQQAVTLRELAGHPLILSDEGLSVRHMLALFKSVASLPRIAHRAASVELLRSLAANGEGVGITYSHPPGNTSYDGKQLAAVPISDASAAEPIVLISHAKPSANSLLAQAQGILKSVVT